MKEKVIQFKSMLLALKDLQQFVVRKHVRSGKPLARFDDMRPRELLANWLVCAAINHVAGIGRMHFTSDPTGGDGIIRDKITGRTWRTEHVIALRSEGDTRHGEELILAAIQAKQDKGGAAYASGKTLFVLAEGIGEWKANRIARALPKELAFDGVWVVALNNEGEGGVYRYHVANLDLSNGDAPVWEVTILASFEDWRVEPVQGLGAIPSFVLFQPVAPQAKI